MSRPLPLKSLDVAGLRDFRVDAPRKPSITERFGALILHPAVTAYSRVCVIGTIGLFGLGSVVIAMGALVG